MEFFKSLKWWQKALIIYVLIAVPYSFVSNDGTDKNDSETQEDDGDTIVMLGKTKNEWRSLCLRMADRKRECAVAYDVEKCVKIKAGSEYDMSQGNCLGDVPLFPR